MRRREFITLLGSAAAAWPLAVRAQQPTRRVGLLMSTVEDDPEGQARVRAFLEGLQELGWAYGRNVRVDIRWTAGNPADSNKYAAELVALAPDVIFASASVNVAALQRVTRTVPIVFANVIDPVGAGFVASLARPGGSTTGFSAFEYSQRDASCCSSRSFTGRWDRPIRRDPGPSAALIWGRVISD